MSVSPISQVFMAQTPSPHNSPTEKFFTLSTVKDGYLKDTTRQRHIAAHLIIRARDGCGHAYILKLSPHPQVRRAFGFTNLNPEPDRLST